MFVLCWDFGLSLLLSFSVGTGDGGTMKLSIAALTCAARSSLGSGYVSKFTIAISNACE